MRLLKNSFQRGVDQTPQGGASHHHVAYHDNNVLSDGGSDKINFFELSKGLFEKGASVRFQAKGWSMRPFIKDGDFITVKPVNHSSIKTGDVVFYSTAENKVIVHRVIKRYKKKGPKAFLIKGDATFGCAESINVQNVFGKVVEIERKGRTRRLESKRYQVINLFLSGISPFSHWIYPIGSEVKQRGRKALGCLLEKMQSPKFYRTLAKKLLKTDVHVQMASASDAGSLFRLYDPGSLPGIESRTHVFRDQLADPEQSGFWITAKRKDKIIGGVNLSECEEGEGSYAGWWISGMKVNWRYRGLGIEEKLLIRAEEIAEKQKAQEIKLLVFRDATPAINLYRKMGYRRISIRELDKQLDEEANKTLRRQIILVKDIRSG